MNKKELVKTVSEKTEMTQKMVGEIVDVVFGTISDTLVEGNDVAISGFGKFEVVEKPARECRNPRTGETVMSEPHNAVKFKASGSLKLAVR